MTQQVRGYKMSAKVKGSSMVMRIIHDNNNTLVEARMSNHNDDIDRGSIQRLLWKSEQRQ